MFRWLWPLRVFIFFAVAATLGRRLAAWRVQPTVLVSVFAASATLLAVLNLPTTATTLTPNSHWDAIPLVRALNCQLGILAGKGPILIDQLSRDDSPIPTGAAVIAELQRREIPFVTSDPVLVHQFGTARRAFAKAARSELFLRVGNDSLNAPPGTPKVVEHEGLTPPEQRELEALKAQIRRYIRPGRLRLNRDGQGALANGQLPALGDPSGNSPIDPDRLFSSGKLVVMVMKHHLVLNEPWTRRFQRYAELQSNADNHTVALFLAPLR